MNNGNNYANVYIKMLIPRDAIIWPVYNDRKHFYGWAITLLLEIISFIHGLIDIL